MAKKKKIKVDHTEEEAVEIDVTPQIQPEPPQAPISDMWAIYWAIRERLEKNEVSVNRANQTQTQVLIEKDTFVSDCMASIPPMTGRGPEYAPFNFAATITCVVPKGDNTITRLEILKDEVRAALMHRPLHIGIYTVSFLVTNEQNAKAFGVRTSALTLLVKVSLTKSRR